MARILFTWELGGGMGHILPYASIFKALESKGHELVFILKDLRRVNLIRGIVNAVCFQAPLKSWRDINTIKLPLTYSHILHNMAFADSTSAFGLIEGWRALFNQIKPELVVFEHSPTALLAARGFSFQKILIGTGFTIPPPVYPLPNLRFWVKTDEALLKKQEDRTLGIMNALLGHYQATRLDRISDLFASETQVLKTFRELDPYPERMDGNYYGSWIYPAGEEPLWPEGEGKKAFVYLAPFSTLPSLLSALIKLEIPSLVYIEGIGLKLKDKFNSPALRFVDKPQNMTKVAEQCDFGILNGTMNTTTNLLLAGKPALHLPLFLEQTLTAHNIEKLGAGLSTPTLRPEDMEAQLRRLISSDDFTQAAQKFADRYAALNAQKQNQWLLDQFESRLS
jgi:UDP:flavonoid glycosyltransferase YjiC (YdhE family)